MWWWHPSSNFREVLKLRGIIAATPPGLDLASLTSFAGTLQTCETNTLPCTATQHTMTASCPPGTSVCGGGCIYPTPANECPTNAIATTLPRCYDVPSTSDGLCEADGECGARNDLENPAPPQEQHESSRIEGEALFTKLLELDACAERSDS